MSKEIKKNVHNKASAAGANGDKKGAVKFGQGNFLRND
jgi:hypothetical protein